MRRLVIRVVALVAILGQLQQLPAAVACVQQHQKATSDHCGLPIGANGPAIQAEHAGMASPLCATLGNCAAQTPATVARAGADLLTGPVFTVPSPAPDALTSYLSPPVTPPPQA